MRILRAETINQLIQTMKTHLLILTCLAATALAINTRAGDSERKDPSGNAPKEKATCPDSDHGKPNHDHPCPAPTGTATNFWALAGNAGTSPTNGNFLGTTDDQPLELDVNGLRVMRYEFGWGIV